MWTWLIAMAYGSCMGSGMQTIPRIRTVAPTQPIVVDSSWGTTEHLVRRLRLRGPDGQLVRVRRETLASHARLVPRRPLAPGTYTVEERGDYDVHGERLRYVNDPVHHSAWFPAWTVDVVEPVAAGPVPEVTWSPIDPDLAMVRRPARPMLSAAVHTEPGASWVELEVEGTGVVDIAPVARNGVHRVTTAPATYCTDAISQSPAEPGEAVRLRARVVAQGPGGWTATTPWSDHVARPPTGHAGLDQLRTWSRVRGRVSREDPVVPPSRCGPLRSVDVEHIPDGHGFLDDDGHLHVMAPKEDGWTLDGAPMPLDPKEVWTMAAHRGQLWVVAGREDPRLLRFDDGQLVQEASVPVSRTYDLTAIAVGLQLRWVDGDRRPLQQAFTADLAPVDEPILDRRAILADNTPDGVRVNGELVGIPRARHWLSEDHVAFEVGAQVRVYDADATLVQTVEVPDEHSVQRVAVDDEGVKLLLYRSGRRQPVTMGIDADGRPFDVDHLPPEPIGPRWHDVRLPFGDGEVEWLDQTLVVRDADGASSPALPTSSFHFGVEGEQVVVPHRIIVDDQHVLRVERFECSREALGVPARWTPTPIGQSR